MSIFCGADAIAELRVGGEGKTAKGALRVPEISLNVKTSPEPLQTNWAGDLKSQSEALGAAKRFVGSFIIGGGSLTGAAKKPRRNLGRIRSH